MTNATAQRTVTSSPGVGVELEPEVVLPSQFHFRAGLDASLQPEKRLMLAVMEDAVGTFQKYVWARDRAGQRLLAEVEEWFESDDTEWPYSFVNICHSLNLDVSFMRNGLRRWKQPPARRTRRRGEGGSVPVPTGKRLAARHHGTRTGPPAHRLTG